MADTVEKRTDQPRPAPPYPPGLLPWYWLLLALGGLSNDDGEGDENGKKVIGLDWQNNNFARASRALFCTFLCCRCTTTSWNFLILRFVTFL